MHKAVFLDRDGTINIDYGYVHKINDFKLIPGVWDALRSLQENDYLLFIVTSQSGVGRGYYTKDDYYKVMKHFNKLCQEQDIHFKKIVQCFHAPEENCECRKPKPFLVNNLLSEFYIDKSKSFFIGDKTSDIQLANNANIKGILVKTGNGGKDNKCPQAKPFCTVADLPEAVKVILDERDS